MGQIVKNFPGTIEAEEKLRITKACYLLGLRSLSWYLNVLRKLERAFVWTLAEVIHTQDPSLNVEKYQSYARQLFFHLGWILSSAYILRVATSVGSPDLKGTYRKISAELNYTSAELIDIALKLDQTGKPPLGKLRDLGKTLKSNNTALWVLRLLALRHMYMFGGEYKTKQAICEALGITYHRFQTLASSEPVLLKSLEASIK